MSNNTINNTNINSNIISSLLNPKLLNSLTAENQKIAIDSAKEFYSKEKDGGILGWFLGTNKTNVSMHIVLILSIFLIIAVCCLKDKEIWDKIFTIIATFAGYIFGATQKGD